MKTKLLLVFLILSNTFLGHLEASGIQHFQFPQDGKLSEAMIHHYESQGFLIFDDYLDGQACDALRAEGEKLIDGVNPDEANLTVFSTDDSQNVLLKDNYFIESADKVWPFFEHAAIKDGKLVVDKSSAVNKFGHAVGEQVEAFKKVTFTTQVGDIAKALGIKDPRLAQSMLILKPAETGGAVLPHQDAIFIHSLPHNELGYWTPLVDATTENACLWVIPGSHKLDLIAHYIKNPDGEGFIFVDPKTNEPIKPEEYFPRIQQQEWPQENYVPVELKAGSLIVFHSHLVHQSQPNTSHIGRPAYTFHVIDGQSQWDDRNWLQRSEFVALESSSFN